MNSRSLKLNIMVLFVIIVCMVFSRNVLAKNAIGFLADPERSTIIAGEPFSNMEPTWDWGIAPTPPCDPEVDDCDHPLASAMDGHPYAIPNLEEDVSIETWRTTTHLHLVFSLDDQTRGQWPGGETLGIGDKVIIQIDPNKSGGSELEVGSGLNKDYRFEIVLKDNLIFETLRREPINIPGPTLNIWSSAPSTPAGFTGYASDCTPSDSNPYDCLEVEIPLSELGNPSSDIGISMGIINDLGHGHPGTGGLTVWDITGTVFPSSMGLEMGSDPELIDAGQASGNWLVPGEWGTGYFAVVPLEVSFSHSPSWAYSNSFRLSNCNITDWNAIGEITADNRTDQFSITNWYHYNPDNPCQMKIWLKAFKTGGGVARGRLFFVWGRPGISPQDWFPVALTPVINFTDPQEIISLVWGNVPPVTFSSHPCLRVYLLPEILTSPFDEARLSLTNPSIPDTIDTDAELDAFELHYSFYYPDPKTAQINFRAISTGSCSIPECVVIGARGTDNKRIYLASKEDLQSRGVLNLSNIPVEPELIDHESVRFAQVKDSAADSATAIANPKPTDDKKQCYISVDAQGFSVATENADRNYTYITPVGAVGWLIPCEQVDPQEGLELPFPVANPPLTTRNFVQDPPQNIAAPAREVFLLVRVDASSGHSPPEVKVEPPSGLLQPGESTEASVTIRPSLPGPWSLGLQGGANFPHSSFNNLVDSGVSFNLDLEYSITSQFSAQAILGYHYFDDDGLGKDQDIFQISINGRYYPFQLPLNPFINAGFGYYFLDPGSDDFGYNIGAGLKYDLTPRWSLEGTYNYHHVITNGVDPEFSAVQIGIKYNF